MFGSRLVSIQEDAERARASPCGLGSATVAGTRSLAVSRPRKQKAAERHPTARPSPVVPTTTSGGRTSRQPSWSHAVAVAILVVVTLLPRLLATSGEELRGAYRPTDPDTLRRITRLQRLAEPAATYPYRDVNDGWYLAPERRGTVLHWTRPMDVVLSGFDRVLGRWSSAPRFVAAACWAGPILGVLTTVGFYVSAAHVLGAPSAFVAALLFSLSYGSVAAGVFGNGDHAALQQLASVIALLSFLGVLAHRHRADAIVAGAALGFALWVSAESMVVLYCMVLAAVGGLVAAAGAHRGTLARLHVEWAVAAFVVAAIGALVEHAGGLGFDWDVVSGFQLYQLLVFAAFAAMAMKLSGREGATTAAIGGAGVLAVGAGLLPFLVIGRWRDALQGQIAASQAIGRWVQTVAESAGLFMVEGFFVPARAWEYLTWLVLALPVLAVVVARDRRRPRELRLGLLLVAAVLSLFVCYSVKLLGLFAVPFALLIVTGGEPLLDAAARRLGVPRSAMLGGGVVAACFLFLLPPHPELGIPTWRLLVDSQGRVAALRDRSQATLDELLAALRALPAESGPRRAILADWPLGADILYATGHPVVASGYHRNFVGVRDAYRLFVARDPEDNETVAEILRERGVRWIVAKRDPHFFIAGTRAFPELGAFGRIESIDYLGDGAFSWKGVPAPPDTKRTFLWRAAITSWFQRPTRFGELEVVPYADVPNGSLRANRAPAYVIYEVRMVDGGSG